MKTIRQIIFIFAVMLASFTGRGYADTACDVGQIIFRDAAYGAATGLAVGGIVTLVNENPGEQWRYNLGYGGLVGVGIGTAVGIIEILSRDCTGNNSSGASFKKRYPSHTIAERMKWTPAIIITQDEALYGVSVKKIY